MEHVLIIYLKKKDVVLTNGLHYRISSTEVVIWRMI